MTMRRLRTALCAVAMVGFATPASAITYQVLFTASSGTAPTGTITFVSPPANGSASPTEWKFTDGISTWNADDTVNVGPFGTFNSGALVGITLDVDDFAIPARTLTIGLGGNWAGDSGNGTYTTAVIPEPAAALLLATGLTTLAVRVRRRRLH